MGRYLFFSHDGYGLGHIRRNSVIARALSRAEPDAGVWLMTGVPSRPAWLERWGDRVIRIPPLVKDGGSGYRPLAGSFEQTVSERRSAFTETVDRIRPDVVVVDRHPLGTAGELGEGLEIAVRRGSALVLGLRDILDDPDVVAEEIGGDDWAAVPDLYDMVLVYGASRFCDHRDEYGLPVAPTYCGWVVEPPPTRRREPRLLAAAAGGGGDGDSVFRLAAEAVRRRPDWRAEVAVGPFADPAPIRRAARGLSGRLKVHEAMAECGALFARAGRVLQMAGYNSTIEAIAAGIRSVLVPRRFPRREQAIRAERLARLGLADVVDPDTRVDDLMPLLGRPRTVDRAEVARSGIDLRGAERAAGWLRLLAKDVRAA